MKSLKVSRKWESYTLLLDTGSFYIAQAGFKLLCSNDQPVVLSSVAGTANVCHCSGWSHSTILFSGILFFLWCTILPQTHINRVRLCKVSGSLSLLRLLSQLSRWRDKKQLPMDVFQPMSRKENVFRQWILSGQIKTSPVQSIPRHIYRGQKLTFALR